MSPRILRLTLSVCVLLLGGCTERKSGSYSGYVEGEYVRVASPFAGELTALQVKRGDQVAAEAPLFVLERDNEKAAREEAQARLRRAQAQFTNLQKGQRQPELDAIRAQLAQAQASSKLSETDLKRTEELLAAGFISPSKLDEARAAQERDRARVQQLQADLAAAKQAGRPDEIAAAAAESKAGEEALAQADWKLRQKSQEAPLAGLVADTLYQQGEWVPAGAPVVSLLPPGNVKVRFFVPETDVGSLSIGQQVRVTCDGCAAPVAAILSFIAPQAEYTPPVIYSKENRANLVFLVEARPGPADATHLHPGQPVEVQITRAPIAGAPVVKPER